MFTISLERPADSGAIEHLLDNAFGPSRLAKASYRFRHGLRPTAGLSRAAREGERVVGAIRYWPIKVGAKGTPALLLGPLAVVEDRRGRGIGRALVAQTLDRAMLAGHRLVLLVGDLAYYERFGFALASHHGIFMSRENPVRLLVRALKPGALTGVAGEVRPWRSVRGSGIGPTGHRTAAVSSIVGRNLQSKKTATGG